MRVVVLGSTGMLGNAVGRQMVKSYGEDNVFLSYRNESVSYGKNKFYFNALTDNVDKIPECDYIINCIGIIKPFMSANMASSIFLNSVFPLRLAGCSSTGKRVIHITTDCVFSGKKGNYTEEDFHDADDDYGKSKSLGEICKKDVMVIRTSIIGEEIHNNASLVEWIKSQKGKKVKGFTNHLWNGVTTKQYSKIICDIINQDMYSKGLFHVFSNPVNKFDLVGYVNDRFKLDLIIEPFEAPCSCDRTMSTLKELNSKLNISDIREQIYNI